jgi:transcriptional regulator with AAA-type ATPase domain
MTSLAEVSRIADRETPDGSGTEEIIGASLALRRVLRDVDVVSPTDSTVLIRGETGTAEKLVARAIHVQGLLRYERRPRGRPFARFRDLTMGRNLAPRKSLYFRAPLAAPHLLIELT